MNLCRGVSAVGVAGLWWSLLSSPLGAQTGPYPNAPQIVRDRINQAVTDIAANAANSALDRNLVASPVAAVWNDLVLYTVADALADDQQTVRLRKLAVYRNLGETARTDKQAGATATGSGSTSLLEKAGIPLLLAYALEHGAVTQEVNGTAFTLSASPYGLMALAAGGDTAENYEKYNLWTRVGASVTFNVDQGQTPSVQNISAKQISEYSVRVRLLGDRSTRSAGFKRIWEETVGKQIQRRLNAVSRGLADLFNQHNQGTDLAFAALRARNEILDEINQRLGALASLADEDKAALTDLILAKLESAIFQPVRSNAIAVPESSKNLINSEVIPALIGIQADLEEARANLERQLEQFFKSSLLTFSYTNHRTPMGSDYSEFKLLFERKVAPFEVVGNAGVSLYHHPQAAVGQERVRDFHFSFSLEGKSKSPFRFADDLSQTSYSFSGRYQRMKETEANIGVFQAKVEFALGGGLSLPFSVTYANRTELVNEKEVRGNFGLSFDLDKLYGLLLRLPRDRP